MTSLKPIIRSTLGEQIAMQIFSMVSKGTWKVGERLPSEAELCKSLHVGRSSLREAMKSLVFVGVVEVHPGEGTFVAEGPSKFLERIITQGMLHSANDLADLFEARVTLEPELAALCAQRASPEELRTMDDLFAHMGRVLLANRAEFPELDLAFHLAIATGSRNRSLGGYLRAIRAPLMELITKGAQSMGGSELAHTHHLKILEAIKQHNSAKARSLMRAHLRVFQGGYLVLSRVSESGYKPQDGSRAVGESAP